MVRFAPSSTATLRAIFRTSLSVKPIARSAFKSWQMPKKSMFGFIRVSPMHKAGTVFHSGIRFPRFLTFVLLALFVATPQASGRFQTAAAGCRSTGLAPLRGSLRAAPITFRCGWTGVPLYRQISLPLTRGEQIDCGLVQRSRQDNRKVSILTVMFDRNFVHGHPAYAPSPAAFA